MTAEQLQALLTGAMAAPIQQVQNAELQGRGLGGRVPPREVIVWVQRLQGVYSPACSEGTKLEGIKTSETGSPRQKPKWGF